MFLRKADRLLVYCKLDFLVRFILDIFNVIDWNGILSFNIIIYFHLSLLDIHYYTKECFYVSKEAFLFET